MSIQKQRKKQHNRDKVFMQNVPNNTAEVTNVKPYPIPDLTGQVAEDFERDIKNGSTEQQKERMRRATAKFVKAKRQR
jgi:hypothetical protein